MSTEINPISVSLQQTQQRAGQFNAVDTAFYQLTVKERDRERIINTELRLEIERLKRILDIHGINYQLK
jgi:hypothetical protein